MIIGLLKKYVYKIKNQNIILIKINKKTIIIIEYYVYSVLKLKYIHI